MRLFGINISFKRQPRWASYEDVLALSDAVRSNFNSIEAMRKKVYRDDKKGDDKEIEAVLGDQAAQPVNQTALGPGDPPPPGLIG